jgi:hypothetical protein
MILGKKACTKAFLKIKKFMIVIKLLQGGKFICGESFCIQI